MWRFLHCLGWLIALGMAGWVSGLVAAISLDAVFEGYSHLVTPFLLASVGAGLIAGLLLSPKTWSRRAWDRPLAVLGGVLVALGTVTGAFLLLASATEGRAQPDVPFAGLELLILGVLAFALAAIGIGLALAGIAGRIGGQPPTPIGSSH